MTSSTKLRSLLTSAASLHLFASASIPGAAAAARKKPATMPTESLAALMVAAAASVVEALLELEVEFPTPRPESTAAEETTPRTYEQSPWSES